MKSLIQKCEYHKIAHRELLKSIRLGKIKDKTLQGYIEAGCLNGCDGYSQTCKNYFSFSSDFLEWQKNKNNNI